ncbi:hypothetical protein SAMN05421688_2363 [Poseidonocella pacifica]|uniref:Uncharacterized protein n=1 Tax=Poseidonocella pacifica TaxID=871651 RepID=A0A1I0XJR3_9RHOB|nr:hypothetical protein [Poseidonocella pacifica]SFB01231.1 hypothetical protein SAMN05421688_2363 [Poseidonocella pacifica]
MIEAIKVAEFARALHSAHGDRAVVEVSERMRRCSEGGRTSEAEDWRRIRDAIYAQRGPRQT